MTHKRAVDRANDDAFARLCEATTCKSESDLGPPLDVRTYEAVDEGYNKAALKDCPGRTSLRVAIGAQVVCVKNTDGVAPNGARGVVVAFTDEGHGSKGLPVCRFLLAGGKTVEKVVRFETWKVVLGGVVVAKRTMLPIALGYAVSVHKAQGMTIPRMRADLRNVFEYGQLYTCLSRAQGLEGISLVAPIKGDGTLKLVHPKVKEFYWGEEGGGAEKGQGQGKKFGRAGDDENDENQSSAANKNKARASATAADAAKASSR